MAEIVERDGKLWMVEPEGEWEYGPPLTGPTNPEERIAELETVNADLESRLADIELYIATTP